MKAFFFKICFFIFSTLDIFSFLPKKPQKEGGEIIKKKYHLRRILEKKYATCRYFEKFQSFFGKNPSISPKNPNFEHFKNYSSSRILRQICYNLVKRKFHVQKRERASFYCERNWQTTGLKNQKKPI